MFAGPTLRAMPQPCQWLVLPPAAASVAATCSVAGAVRCRMLRCSALTDPVVCYVPFACVRVGRPAQVGGVHPAEAQRQQLNLRCATYDCLWGRLTAVRGVRDGDQPHAPTRCLRLPRRLPSAPTLALRLAALAVLAVLNTCPQQDGVKLKTITLFSIAHSGATCTVCHRLRCSAAIVGAAVALVVVLASSSP